MGMSPEQPPGPIDLLHKQLRTALDQHLASLSHQYEEALAAARFEVAAEADQAITARVEAVRSEWQARLEAEIAAVRGEAEQRVTAQILDARTAAEREWASRLESEVGAARTEVERRLLAESLKARAEAEQQFAAKLESEIQTARAETERRLLAESLKARMEAEQEAAEKAARLREELEKNVASERQKLADAQSRIEEERERVGTELTTLRQRVDALESERKQTQARLDAQKNAAQTELQSERQRMSGEIESHRRRLDAMQEQMRKAEADVEAERRRAASEREEAGREATTRIEAVRAQHATEIDALRRQTAEQLESARREARDAADREHAQKTTLANAAAVQLSERQAQLAGFDRLLTSIRALDNAHTLTEALDALLQHAASSASRAAVFLVNGDRLHSWKAIGFPQLGSSGFESALTGAGLLAQAIHKGDAVSSSPSQPAPAFAALPSDRVGLAVPIHVGGRAVALLYADNAASAAPESPASWPEAVETLARHASTVLGLLTAVRTAQALGVATGGNGEADEQGARRYARLLVSEIKLYNEAAVKTGRERRDLLERLRPEIARARRLYEERVPTSLGARSQYFQQELLHTLADGDPALLGNP
jgi:hypothetical protein